MIMKALKISYIANIINKAVMKRSFIKVSSAVIAIFLFYSNLFQPHFFDILIKGSWYGDLCEALYEGIDNSNMLGWLTVTVISIIAFYLYWKLYCTKSYYLYSIIIAQIGLWILIDNFWIYPRFSFINLRLVLSCAFLIAPVPCIINLLKKYYKEKRSGETTETQNLEQGLSNDDLQQEADNTKVAYAKTIAKKLISTPTPNTSYALGMEGEWGSGKTVFLKTLKESIKENQTNTEQATSKAILTIDFNPWQSISSKSLIQEFFDILADTVSQKINGDLFSPIQRYSSILIALEETPGFFSAVKNIIFDNSESTLAELKERISKSLKNNNTQLFIFIDDIDRLDGNEIFEVLRLIRNTADFPFLYYIVAYDKEYMTSRLRNMGINKSDKYLEKIFNLEICLPRTEDQQLEQELIKELSSMLPAETNTSQFKTSIIRGYLDSYRDIKRFARQFSVNYIFLRENVGDQEFDAADLFLLELIRYINDNLYSKLKNKPLVWLGHKSVGIGLYVFFPNDKLKSELKDTPGHQYLLDLLFKESDSFSPSIRFPNNYRRYFSFKLEDDEITAKEFFEWINIEEIRSELLFCNMVAKTRSRNSLLYQFSVCNIHCFTLPQLLRYFSGLIQLFRSIDKQAKPKAYDLIMNVLLSKLRADNNALIDSDQLFDKITSFITVNNQITTILNYSELFHILKQTENGLRERIEKLESINFKRYLELENPDRFDLIDISSTLSKIYRNSLTWSTYVEYGYGEDKEYKTGVSPLTYELCDFFSRTKSLERGRFIDELSLYDMQDPESGVVYQELWPEEIFDEQITSLFGSFDTYHKFLEYAFYRPKLKNPPMVVSDQ